MESVLEPLKEFSKNSVRLVKRCTKPDRRGGTSCFAMVSTAPKPSYNCRQLTDPTLYAVTSTSSGDACVHDMQ